MSDDAEIPDVLQLLTPRGFVRMEIHNPLYGRDTTYLTSSTLKISVVDSAFTTAPMDDEVTTNDSDDEMIPAVGSLPPLIASLIVPPGREGDWIFQSRSGLRRILMKFYNLARLIVISNKVEKNKFYNRVNVDEADEMIAQQKLKESILKLHPQSHPGQATPTNVFVKYEDRIKTIVPLSLVKSRHHVKIKVEVIEVDSKGDNRDFRARLTFKSCPDYVQCDIRVLVLRKDGGPIDKNESLLDWKGKVDFKLDFSDLIQPDVQAMISALAVGAQYFEELYEQKVKPIALCLGAGSCCLVNFLKSELKFRVMAVDIDSNMHLAALGSLDLFEDENLVFVESDARDFLKETFTANSTGSSYLARLHQQMKIPSTYDVIFLDINSTVDNIGPGISSPTRDFIKFQVMLEVRLALHEGGLLIINVVSPDILFHCELMESVKKVFKQVHRIDLKNEREFILVASKPSSGGGEGSSTGSSGAAEGRTPLDDDMAGGQMAFMEKLKEYVPSKYLNAISEV